MRKLSRKGVAIASAAIVVRALPTEASRWKLAEEVLLRGWTRPTRVAVPE